MAQIPKYRELTSEELHGLEKEFVDYLVVNGITADDWVKMKQGEPEKAEDIIVLFSDVIFEGIMRNVQFLDFIIKDEIRTFQCLSDKMVLVGMQTENADHDFTDTSFINKASKQPISGIKVYATSKDYTKQREVELFEMTASGCMISDGKLFKAISLNIATDPG